jgi:SAM-dependent methyltransferase
MLTIPNCHLDIGCGDWPRNPYRREYLYGLDIRHIDSKDGVIFKKADLNYEKIPFEDNFFGSVSAFDYLEHVPRVLVTDHNKTKFPFIEIMNEVWRVLANGGKFYALTPCYPTPQAFQDPTHVNFITESTHQYFCGDDPEGLMYGFKGKFKAEKCEWVIHKDSHYADQRNIKQEFRRLLQKTKGKLSHFKWELTAIK